jgi:phage shock protein A
MGILGRINSVIKSNLNSVLDKMTDPAKEIDLLVIELEENLKKAREEVVTCNVDAKKAAQQVARHEEECAQWQRRAEQAVRAGDDALAREALERKLTADRDLEDARKRQAEQVAYVQQLKASLKALEARINEIKGRKETLKARAKAAKDGRPALSGGKAMEDWSRMEDRIESMEAENDLSAGSDARDASVAAKFAALEKQQGDPKVEDALAELKRKMQD